MKKYYIDYYRDNELIVTHTTTDWRGKRYVEVWAKTYFYIQKKVYHCNRFVVREG